jgi:hypothetical protein
VNLGGTKEAWRRVRVNQEEALTKAIQKESASASYEITRQQSKTKSRITRDQFGIDESRN